MLYDRKHILVRSPLRVSFIGAGTDEPAYIAQGRTGHVIAAAIDLYVYVALKDMFDANVRVHHAEIETEPIASRIRHDNIRVGLEEFGLFRGVEVVLTSDVMTTGSGLGGSAAILSAMSKACSAFRNQEITDPFELAKITIGLEQKTGAASGLQDHYTTAFGGFNSLTFRQDDVDVKPVNISADNLRALEKNCFLVFTNLTRQAHSPDLSNHFAADDPKRIAYLESLQHLSHQFLNELESETCDFSLLGKLLHQSWLLKRETERVARNPYIEQLYESLQHKGILGGKVLGSGEGGFFLAFAKDEKTKQRIKYDLYPNFITTEIYFTSRGTEVLWKSF